MNKFLKKINIFAPPIPEKIASDELEEAKRELLKAQSTMEYAKAMVNYRTDQIRRLNCYLGEA